MRILVLGAGVTGSLLAARGAGELDARLTKE